MKSKGPPVFMARVSLIRTYLATIAAANAAITPISITGASQFGRGILEA